MSRAPESTREGDVPGKGAGQWRGPVHWLVRVAERAGLAGGETLDVPPGTPSREAWPVITRAFSIPDARLAELVGEYFRLEVAKVAEADPNVVPMIPEAMARKHHIFPLQESDRHLVVATCDPTDVEAERALEFSTGRTAIFEVAAPAAIQDALDARYAPDRAVETLLGTLESEMDDADMAVKLVEEMGPEHISEDEVQATPVVKLTNLILRDGIAQGASDIHIEPGRRTGLIRYRVDGVLRKHMELPMSALNRIISRIKILSRLDIADRLRPQDGKARVRIKNLSYDLRVSTIPTGGAEKCVIRVLDSNVSPKLQDLGIPPYELERMRALIANRDGLVMVIGPTGSGKTTTLYGALRELADGKVNVMTVEDPIEYDLPAIIQTQVETKQGLTVRDSAPLHPAPGPGRDSGRRDPRPGDSRDCCAGSHDRPLSAGHRARERRRERSRTSGRHGSPARDHLADPAGSACAATHAQGVRGVRGARAGSADLGREAPHGASRHGAGGACRWLLGVRLHRLSWAPSDPGSVGRGPSLPAGHRGQDRGGPRSAGWRCRMECAP